MPEHNKEKPIIDTELSRRKFLRNAAIGAVGAGSVFALKGVEDVLAQTNEIGEATLDGVLLTYAAAPNGSTGGSTLTIRETQTFTLRLQATVGASLTISTGSTFSAGTFTVGSSATFTQGVSASVTDA